MELVLKGVIFDLAGVLVSGSSREFYQEMQEKYNLKIDHNLWRDLYRKASAGAMSYAEFVKGIASELSTMPADLEKKLADVVSSKARIVHGAYDVLLHLQKRGIRSVILTNNIAEWVRIIEGNFRFKRFVSQILVSAVLCVRKPDPKAYLLAANSIGVPPQQLVYVGDEDEDIRGARNVGIRTVFIAGEDSLSRYCHYRIWNLREILKFPMFTQISE